MEINELLIKAGVKYKKDLLLVPMIAFDEIRPFFNIVTGVQGKIMGGVLNTPAQFRPYKSAKGATDSSTIEPCEWETFLGDLIEEFDPNLILGTLYTEKTSKMPDEMEIAKKVAMSIALSAGEKLLENIFIAKRNTNGSTSKDLFNGFDTITDAYVLDETDRKSVV